MTANQTSINLELIVLPQPASILPSSHIPLFCPYFLVADISKPPTHSYHHPLPANIEYRGRNHKVVSGNMSWYDAMRMCKENDSDLVSITDAYHQAFLTVLVNRLGVPHWIGLYSQDVCIHAVCTLYLCTVHVCYIFVSERWHCVCVCVCLLFCCSSFY